ncbi:MAG: sporulation protein YqfD [Oscillospiraceae bacterium]|nr:sporulation protein YqfD [Oscillospiraceae bacterium]
MLGVVNYLRGQVEVEIEGTFPERFFNLCSQQGVAFWDLKRQDDTRLRARMHLSGYRRAQACAGQALCTLTLLGRRGAPVLWRRLKKRSMLLAGALAGVAALLFLSRFVWEFEVRGNRTVGADAILHHLAELGVKPGVYGPSVDIETVKNEMLLRIGELSWLTVNIRGSRAVVEVRERAPKPEIRALDVPCNVVAARDGVVTRMETLAGTPQVAPGQTVTRGQLLVSGVVDSRQVGARFLHARARVFARVWRDITAVTPLQTAEKQYTGRVSKQRTLVIAGYRTKISVLDFKFFEKCDKVIKTSTLRLPFGGALPVSLVTETAREYTTRTVPRDREAAATLLREALKRKLAAALGGEGAVLKAGFAETESAAALTVRLLAECEEQVAVQVPLG